MAAWRIPGQHLMADSRPLRRLTKSGLRSTARAVLFSRIAKSVLDRAVPLEWIGSHLAELLADMEIDCVLDVGANEGQYALMLRDIGYRGRIVSFEPVKANVERLEALSASDPNWDVQPLALGDSDGVQEINVSKWSVFSSLDEIMDAEHLGAGATLSHRESVRVARLDTIWDDLFRAGNCGRVFLKLDTQGHEFHVLAGAERILNQVVALQIELSVVPAYKGEVPVWEALGRLQQLGFQITGAFPLHRDKQLLVNAFDCTLRRSTQANA